MKKLNIVIFAFICLLFTVNVSALTCTYNNFANTLQNNASVSVTINDNGTVKGTITMMDGKSVNINATVMNWNNVKSQYESSGKCPYFANYTYKPNALANEIGTSINLYYDESSVGSNKLVSSTYGNDSDDSSEKEQALKALNDLSNYCNAIAAKKFDYTSCWDEDRTTTKYTKCKNEASSYTTQVNEKRVAVDGYASNGLISKDSSEYKTMVKVCESAQKNLSDYAQALEYKSCKEYKKATASGIDCSVKSSDVSDNEYVDNKESSTDVNLDGSVNCSGVFGDVEDKNSIAYYLDKVFNIIKFLGPVLVLLMTIIDLVKVTAAQKQDGELQKLGGKTLKRLIYAALLFVFPSILNLIFNLIGLYGTCGIK